MSKDMNKTILIGRLTRDTELRYTPNGTAVASFSLANSYQFGSGDSRKEQVSYFDCIAWSKLAEICAEYAKKGTRVAVEGRLQQKRWEDQDGKKRSAVELVVENLQFLSKAQDQSENSTRESLNEHNGLGNSVNLAPEDNPFSDDDIPF